MPLYLVRFSYTQESWAALIQNPEDRRETARSYMKKVGGKLHAFYYAMGEHDGYAIIECPDNVAMDTFLLAIKGGGGMREAEATVLMTVEETIEALRRAKKIPYRRPGK